MWHKQRECRGSRFGGRVVSGFIICGYEIDLVDGILAGGCQGGRWFGEGWVGVANVAGVVQDAPHAE